MNCKLLYPIQSTFTYNPGGISEIHLIDLQDFVTYRFREDNLHEQPFVETLFRHYGSSFVSIESVSESNFSESKNNNLYKQTLSTFAHTLDADKLERLMLAEVNHYLVIFRTLQDTWFTFASDQGASLTFTQTSGRVGETNGYNITIAAESAYPLFEAASDILDFKYDTVYQPVFDECEQAIFVPNMDYYKCETT